MHNYFKKPSYRAERTGLITHPCMAIILNKAFYQNLFRKQRYFTYSDLLSVNDPKIVVDIYRRNL